MQREKKKSYPLINQSLVIMVLFSRLKILFCSCSGFLVILSGCSKESPQYWPSSGVSFQNITWEIQLSDSSNVLKETEGQWILPEPKKDHTIQTTLTKHRPPILREYDNMLGRVDQEVYNGSNGQVEFYRFNKNALYLLGYTTPDSSRALTFYDPPLLIFPNSILDVPCIYESNGVTQTLNKRTGEIEKGQKTRVVLKIKDKGHVLLDSNYVNALFCEMSISIDKTIGFGERNLIVPDAVMMKNSMIIAQGLGPVLEWGMRSKEIESHENRDEHRMLPDDLSKDEKREFYIEVTRHEILK
jgi:hypothetical protein